MYKFEPIYCEENGFWYCRKLVNMSLPECYGEFEDEHDCALACHLLNITNENLEMLKGYFAINLRLTEVKSE